MKNFDAYFRSAFTVDNVIFGFDDEHLKVLLIKRKEAPFEQEWALPGYFVLPDEDLDNAARRVLKQLAGIDNVYLKQVKAYSQVNRHPYGRVISVAYFSLVKIADFSPVPDHDVAQEVAWFSIAQVKRLAFDHLDMMKQCFASLKQQLSTQPIGFELLPKKFTLTALQQVYEAILERSLDKRNFRKKVLSMNLLIDLDEWQEGVAHRPAKLYQFDQEKYEHFLEKGFLFELKAAKQTTR